MHGICVPVQEIPTQRMGILGLGDSVNCCIASAKFCGYVSSWNPITSVLFVNEIKWISALNAPVDIKYIY